MFHLLLLVYVIILDKIYFWKISTEDDIDKLTMQVGRLGSAGDFRPDHMGYQTSRRHHGT